MRLLRAPIPAVALLLATGLLAACGDTTPTMVDGPPPPDMAMLAPTLDLSAPSIDIDMAVPCTLPHLMCGDTCADPTTSHANCGACGAACPPEAACVDSMCECPVALCDNACVDTNSDVKHCGACSFSCDVDQLCVGGYCLSDSEWATWPMPTPPQSNLRNPASLATPLAGLVVDDVTGLNWQRAVDAGTYSIGGAQKYCADLVLIGGSWRLPSLIELFSLVDESRFRPAIDTTAFPDTPFANGEAFWTASPDVATPGSFWLVSFDDGMPSTQPGTGQKRVRCVR